ncbi:hypothetical protein [Flavobacterium sp. NRK1]|jgi:hypothetical protein|uniref:hypothetical protein n=1 Tax=Flavobacterium sp. NRK1 TaxID=2954929 RepID=UPI0020921AB4|nr:hypothetical protein [Flavobacterium sp. NRK1]MCO6146718.1 hypothetical protein [Flavobacterium sp. NRK1]
MKLLTLDGNVIDMKKRIKYIFLPCFIIYTVLTMAFQGFGSFNPASLNFYICLAQGAVFALIMLFIIKVEKPAE